MEDEFRVEVELDDPEHGYSIGERLRALDLDDDARKRLGSSVLVTRDGSRLFLYAASEEQAREAAEVVRGLAEADGLTANVAVTRWHPEHGYSIGERLRALDLDDDARRRLGSSVLVTRDGSRLFLYAASEEQAREAAEVVRGLAGADGLTANIAVTRWHPVEEAWKDASIPLPRTPEEEEAEYAAREESEAREAEIEGEYDWHVVADLPSRDEAAELAERLEAEGLGVARRWRYVVAGALTEERAEELAERLRAQLTDDAEVWVEANLSDLGLPAFQFLSF